MSIANIYRQTFTNSRRKLRSGPSQPVSERPVDTEQSKTLDNALKKLFQNDIVPEELLVEYIRRDSNPQPSVPKTDALSN